jgi:hypothetical protein
MQQTTHTVSPINAVKDDVLSEDLAEEVVLQAFCQGQTELGGQFLV